MRLNWLDRVIGYFSPARALRRLEARAALAKAQTPQAAQPRHGKPPEQERTEGGWRSFDEQRERERWR